MLRRADGAPSVLGFRETAFSQGFALGFNMAHLRCFYLHNSKKASANFVASASTSPQRFAHSASLRP
jgi:hypothetical protein